MRHEMTHVMQEINYPLVTRWATSTFAPGSSVGRFLIELPAHRVHSFFNSPVEGAFKTVCHILVNGFQMELGWAAQPLLDGGFPEGIDIVIDAAIAIGLWTVFFWAGCRLCEISVRRYRRRRLRRQLEERGRVVAWEQIKECPNKGVVWLNKSQKHWSGLRLWWIPVGTNIQEEEDLFLKWYERGLLIDDQQLKMNSIAALGHRIEDYYER